MPDAETNSHLDDGVSIEWHEYCKSLRQTLSAKVESFEAGNLKNCTDTWETLTSDPWILSTVQGYDIEFVAVPYQRTLPRQIDFSPSECDIIDTELEKLMRKGVVCPVAIEAGDYFPNIFIRPKKDGTHRIILNLKRLNKSVTYRHFKMDTLKSVIALMTPNCYMASLDLKDAYYTVAVSEDSQKFLKFTWRNQAYGFTCIPNGLGPGPRVFTKIMKPIYARLRKLGHINAGFIDNIYLQGSTADECRENVRETAELLSDAGFVAHPVKSVFTPTQTLSHLGFNLNSKLMTVTLTSEKAKKVEMACKQLRNASLVTIQDLAEVVGQLVASFPGVEYGPLFYRRLDIHKSRALKYSCGNYQATTLLSSECVEDLEWWIQNITTAVSHISHGSPGLISQQMPHLQAGAEFGET